MLPKRALRGWRQMVANQGWAGATAIAAGRLRHKLRSVRLNAATAKAGVEWQATADHSFDREHGVDTSGLIWGEDLASGSRNDAWNTAYYGIPPSVFHAVMVHLPSKMFGGASFIDMGSGKGRAVMLATQYAFARVIGVEIVAELHRTAVANVASYTRDGRNGPPVQLLRQDAAEYRFPSGPLVVYLYHPFCRPVLQRVLSNLEESLAAEPREAAVVYINSELRDVLDRAPWLELVWDATVVMDASDRLADRIGSSEEECAVYRARERAARPGSPQCAS